MINFTNIAPALARAWVRLYTSGMPADLCETRRADVNADLWEHQQDAGTASESGIAIAVEILLRTLLGVPDDIGWRLEVARERRSSDSKRRTGMMTISSGQMRWMGLGAVLAGAVAIGVRLVDVLFDHPGRIMSPSGNSLRFAGAVGATILLILAAQALLSTLGVLGLKVQQRGRTGKSGSAGFALLVAGFAGTTAALVLQASATAFDGPQALWVLVNLLSIPAYVLLIPIGFLLAGLSVPSPSRHILLIVGAYLLLQPWLSAALRARLPSLAILFGSEMASIMLGLGVAGIGYALWSNTRRAQALHSNS